MQSVEARPTLISNWNPSREPCRPYTTIKMRLERPEKLPGKGCRSPHYRSIVTCLGNGRRRGLLSPASKLIASSVHSSGGGLQNKHSEAPPLLTYEINQAYIGDLLRISEAFAAPLSNLFAFVKSGHPACPFITHKQLALYANPRFWQYGLLAFIARCCSFDNQHRHQGPGTAQAEEGKSQTTKEKDVDALTFMRTVIMSF